MVSKCHVGRPTMITTPLKATAADATARVINPAAVRHPSMETEATGTGMLPGDI